MTAGRGRLVSTGGGAVPGSYSYEPARRPGLYEGWFKGRIDRIEKSSLQGDVTLFCSNGITLPITITTFSDRMVSFTAPMDQSSCIAPDEVKAVKAG